METAVASNGKRRARSRTPAHAAAGVARPRGYAGGADYTPYQGLQVTGWPVSTLVRGRMVVREGALVGDPGYGEHIARNRSQFVPAPPA